MAVLISALRRSLVSEAMGRKPWGQDLVETDAAGVLARGFLLPALNGGSGFALAFLSGLFVELPLVDFGEYAGFFTGALEAAHGHVKRFVLADSD
jgi:hypothetical protein